MNQMLMVRLIYCCVFEVTSARPVAMVKVEARTSIERPCDCATRIGGLEWVRGSSVALRP